MKRALMLITLCTLLILGCSKENDDPPNQNPPDACETAAKAFAANVNPIIQSNCATTSGCHGSGSMNGPGPLLTYNQIFNARTSIHSSVSSGRMPKNGTLTAAQKSSILCWINAGAANN